MSVDTEQIIQEKIHTAENTEEISYLSPIILIVIGIVLGFTLFYLLKLTCVFSVNYF